MRFSRIKVISFLVILFIGVDFAFGWEVWKTEHTEVFHYPRDSTVARRASSIVETNFSRVARSIGFRQDLRVRIFLPPTDDEFVFLTQGRIPDWGIGCALPEKKTIVLRPSFKGKVGLEELVVHELSHILLGQATGRARLPRWFDEGVAMWQSRQWRWGQDFTMNKAVFFHRIIPLGQIDNMLLFSSPRAQLAYTESFLALIYLFELGGGEVLPRLVQEMASGKEFSQALLEVCGCSEKEFAAEWERFVHHKFNLASMLLDSFNLWVVILLLFVTVYFVKRYRTRKTLQQWEVEENIEP